MAQSNNVVIKGQGHQKAQEQTAPGNPDSVDSGSSEEDMDDDRYVLRQAPQPNNDLQGAERCPTGVNRSMSEARNPAYVPQKGTTNSNRSSMDVSTCSYNTLIIHDDMFNSGTAADFSSLLNNAKKDRPRSFGSDQVNKEIISEIPDEYLNQSSVLKQLVKEMKLPSRISNNTGMSDECNRLPPSYAQEKSKWRNGTASKDDGKAAASEREPLRVNEEEEEDDEESGDQTGLSKLKSKSQPDLSRIIDIDLETIEALMKDNVMLKQQLSHCYMKVAKTKKVSRFRLLRSVLLLMFWK